MANNIVLSDLWEWNPVTGDPIIPPDDNPNFRFCPTPEEMSEIVHTSQVVEQDSKERLFTFMTSNETQLTTYWDTATTKHLTAYLRLIRSLHLKKIRVEYAMGGIVRLVKLPRDTPFQGQPYVNRNTCNLRLSRNNSSYGLADDISQNALLGWLGPGTFPCCYPLCHLCEQVGRSPTVNLGPHGQLQLTKRASCCTRNAVYVGVCTQCEEEHTFSCYFGESQQLLNRRCHRHPTSPCNSHSILKSNRFRTLDLKRAEVGRVIASGVDPDNILQDWFAHVTEGGIHPGRQRISVVDIIPHAFRRKNRERNLVEEHMFHNDDFHYLGMGRGCLNTYQDT